LCAAGEYRTLWSGYVLSAAGDQADKVSLAMLVFSPTPSPSWTALAYAASYLPWPACGLLLSGLADRLPRRTVLVACDVARCIMTGTIAVPGMPLAAVVALLAAATVPEVPFPAARSASYADILPASLYPLGVAAGQAAGQAGMVAGFAGGGILAGAPGARAGLAADAATFALSAVFILAGLRKRPAAQPGELVPARPGSELRLVFGPADVRPWVIFGLLGAFAAAPEALAVPYAARLGGGADSAGLLFAAGPLGAAAGSAALGRLAGPARQERWMPVLAATSCLVFVLCGTRRGLAWSAVILAASGAFTAYQVAANTGFVRAVPPARRGEAFGIAGSALWMAEGTAFLLAGAAAAVLPAELVITACGVAGAAAAIAASRAAVPRAGSHTGISRAAIRGRPRTRSAADGGHQ
jgi:hypothetical protein